MALRGEKWIYTMGTSNRSAEEFIGVLKSFGIEAVVDVRRFPVSRLEHFGRDELAVLLGQAGLAYFYLGAELGGFRREGYESFTRTAEFKSGLQKLEELASKKRSAVVCAERFPWRCHRRFIARELEKRGWRVEHILEKGKGWVPNNQALE